MTDQPRLFPGIPPGWAEFSPCERYRYALGRHWSDGSLIAWLMLNPSTATATVLDPTIRRCVAFSRRWGYAGLIVLNAYGLRSTDPKGLWTVDDPVGPGNDDSILEQLGKVDRVVVAWGVNAKPERVARIIEVIDQSGLAPECVGVTKDGHPRHPLYVRGNTPLQPWSAR